jgi:hypothetical protein
MPKVGNKEFSYDAEGIMKAQEYSAKTGIPVEVPARYSVGGLVSPKTPSRPKSKKPRGVGKADRGFKTRGSI